MGLEDWDEDIHLCSYVQKLREGEHETKTPTLSRGIVIQDSSRIMATSDFNAGQIVLIASPIIRIGFEESDLGMDEEYIRAILALDKEDAATTINKLRDLYPREEQTEDFYKAAELSVIEQSFREQFKTLLPPNDSVEMWQSKFRYNSMMCQSESDLRAQFSPPYEAIIETAHFFNHSCCPNVSRVSLGETSIFRTVRNVREGDELTISYLSMEDCRDGKLIRRELSRFNFECQCERCSQENDSDEYDCISLGGGELVMELKSLGPQKAHYTIVKLLNEGAEIAKLEGRAIAREPITLVETSLRLPLQMGERVTILTSLRDTYASFLETEVALMITLVICLLLAQGELLKSVQMIAKDLLEDVDHESIEKAVLSVREKSDHAWLLVDETILPFLAETVTLMDEIDPVELQAHRTSMHDHLYRLHKLFYGGGQRFLELRYNGILSKD